MYALIIDGTVTTVGRLPDTARRQDTGQWVLGLPTATVEQQQATGWFQVTDTPRPDDTATTTHDRTVDLVSGTPTVVWTERPKTAEEQAAEHEQANSRTIKDRLTADLTDLQAIIDDTNANINANPAARIKTVARVQRRLIRRALAAYDDTD